MNCDVIRVTDTALAAISSQARYIADTADAPLNAKRWLERIWDEVDSLENYPRRGSLAEEGRYRDYEIRKLVIGAHLLLYSVDEEARTVYVLALRHGRRLPRPDALPIDPTSNA